MYAICDVASASRLARKRHRPSSYREGGFTLIDVLVLIVMLGVVAGLMTVLFSRLSSQSAQNMRSAQMLSTAQALLTEVTAQPMTFCDPQDARVRLANGGTVGGANCASQAELPGPEGGESRYGANAATRFDNVNDYQGFTMPGPGCAGGLCSISGALLNPPGTPLSGCSAAVNTTAQALPGVAALDANGRPNALRVVVTLRCPGQPDTVLEAVRVRHAPRSP